MLSTVLTSHFVDTVSLERYKGENLSNEREFYPPVDIKCRIVHEWTIIKQTQTELVTSKSTIWTFESIGDRDRINGQDVLDIKDGNSLVSHMVEFIRVKI